MDHRNAIKATIWTYVAIVLLMACLFRCHSQPLILIDPYKFQSCTNITASTAVFDGTNDYLEESGGLTSVADGKAFSLSFWVKFDDDGTTRNIFRITALGAANFRLGVYRVSAAGHLVVQARNSANTTILSGTYETGLVSNTWHHVYICVDLANSSNRHIYINGTDATVNWATYTDDTIDLQVSGSASPRAYVGVNADASSDKLSGALAELWFDDSYVNNLAAFYCSGDTPDLGADGSTPTGTAPALYLSRAGGGDTWATDSSGNGNTFTVTGSLGTTTPP